MKKLAPLFAVIIVLSGIAFASQAHATTNTSMCYELYAPVCASQVVECFAAPCYPVYKTYSNSCFMQQDNATIIHEGACTDAETGPIKPTPPPNTTQPYTPPAGCIAWFDGCNSCSMQSSGHSICTMMACQINNTRPGYCTAYAATSTPPAAPIGHHGPGPVIINHPITASSSATTTATTTPAREPSFFSRLWHAFISWFGFH